MRNLFFMLVIANVLFFGWQYWVREPEPPGVALVDPGNIGEPVALISEERVALNEPLTEPTRDPGDAVADGAEDGEDAESAAGEREVPVPVVAKPVAASIGRICVSVGPFTDVAAAQAELKALQSAGAEVAQRATQGNLFIGHWVYVDNIPTRSQARGLLGKLQEGGIREAYLIGGNPGEDVISLGIFSSLSGAERIELKAKSIGIEARMDDRYRQSTVFWLDLRLREGEQGSDLVASYGEDKVVLGDAATCPPD